MLKVLVTGADGQLGREMRNIAAAGARADTEYVFTDVAELDITDAAAVERCVAENGIGAIVNCAAYTDVERAEDDAATAGLLNAEAVRNLAEAAARHDAVLIHISTDYVFGGTSQNTPFAEDAPAAPVGVYGATKLAGERAVAESGCRHIIIRTAWLYSPYGRNFVRTMLALTASKPQLKVVFDQTGTPTCAADLAAVIGEIIAGRKFDGTQGIFHFSNEGVCSWYDFAVEIARLAGHTSCRIEPCRSAEFPSRVTRPSYSVLDKSKIRRTFGVAIPHWRESLEKCIEILKKDTL